MPTTAGGTTYSTDIVTAAGGEKLRVSGSPTARTATRVPFVLYFHGAGGGSSEYLQSPRWDSVRDAIIDRHWLMGSIDAGAADGEVVVDNNWGNNLGRSEYRRLVRHVIDNFHMGPVLLLARSMGGLCAAYAATLDPVIAPATVAAAFNCSVLDLAAAYAGGFDELIDTAYGISGDYDARTHGNDPALFEDVVWGRHVRYWRFHIGTTDTTVPPDEHTEVLQPIIAAHPQVVEAGVVEIVGADHGSQEPYEIEDDLMAFFDRALAASHEGGASATSSRMRMLTS